MKLTHFLLEEKQYTLKKKKKRWGEGKLVTSFCKNLNLTHMFTYINMCVKCLFFMLDYA